LKTFEVFLAILSYKVLLLMSFLKIQQMKNLILTIAITLFATTLFAQNVLQQKIRNSEEFRIASEKLHLEPGSFHTVKTTFIIDNTGTLDSITASSPYPEFETIALDILKSLTKEEAPKHASSQKQKIILPMKFRVETDQIKQRRLRIEARKKKS